MGSYIVGFDNMAHYLPTTTLWLRGQVTLESFIATAPLLYVLTTGLSAVSGSVIFTLKIIPPLLLGALGLSIHAFARRGLAWSPIKSLILTLVGTLYFVALRISWDALREELAIIFLFLSLTSLTQVAAGKPSKKRYLALALSLSAIMLSNQVVAVLGLGIVLFTVIYILFSKKAGIALHLVGLSIPAVTILLVIFYLSPSIPEYRLIFGFPDTPDGWLALFGYASYTDMVVSEAVFVLYCFGFLLPLALLGVKRFRNFQMRSWIILLAIAAFIPMVSPSGLRLLMLLTFPLVFYATEGLDGLYSVRWRRLYKPLVSAGIIYLAAVVGVLSWGFMASTPEAPYAYFIADGPNSHIYSIPSSMLQNTVSINDCADSEKAVAWLKTNMNSTDALLSHRAFYGWALTGIDRDQIVMYEYDNPLDVANASAGKVVGDLYLIWWVDGKGWYGLPSVPPEFSQVYSSGNIAVYVYDPGNQ